MYNIYSKIRFYFCVLLFLAEIAALYVPMSVCPSVRPSVRLSVHPSVHPSVSPSVRRQQVSRSVIKLLDIKSGLGMFIRVSSNLADMPKGVIFPPLHVDLNDTNLESFCSGL